MNSLPLISVIIPCFRNEANIPVTGARLIENEKLLEGRAQFEYILIDDGSPDQTWEALKTFQAQYPEKVKIIRFTRNFGSTNATYAGMEIAQGDCSIIISADLQDPIELFPKMFDYWQKGLPLVVANRSNREEPWLQKFISGISHSLIRRFALSKLPHGGFDFVLFDRKVREHIVQIQDKNSFLPYLLIWLGYDFVSIPYVRKKREIGKSSYTLGKKIKSLVDSFVAFSFFPVRLISILGLTLGAIALLYALVVLVGKYMGWIPIDGWTSMMVILLLVSSFQMIGIGILGEYIWRTLDASRSRPNYIIAETIQSPKRSENHS
ncbi:MAG: glycosyltransferase family 2 protein [Bacteroidia bacterium]|nr:glycosyltransferase family 2 protein [Bacteroidia bacterium]